MRVAITGGSGQLGTLILRRLVEERSIDEIVAIDLRPPLVGSPKIQDWRVDIRDPNLAEHFKGVDVLIHLAFLVAKRGKREEQDAVNVAGSEHVFKQALAAGVRRILYSSSVAQYGVVPTLPNPVTEDTLRTRQPDFWYACAKHDVERRLDELERSNPGLRLARFRPAILIGRRMEHQLGTLMQRRLLPDSPGLPVVWDEDAADAFLLALRTGARGAYNLAADDPRPSKEIAGFRVLKLAARLFGTAEKALAALRILKPSDPGWTRKMNFKLVYSSAKAKQELGWKPAAPTARDVFKRYLERVPQKLDPRLGVFARVTSGTPTQAAGTLHLELSGTNGGDLAVRAAEGKLRVTHEIPRPPDCTAQLRANTLLDLLTKKLELPAAIRRGQVHVDDERAQQILASAIDAFRLAAQDRATAKLLARWMAS
jgi:UDP-glucose 4-epimerase